MRERDPLLQKSKEYESEISEQIHDFTEKAEDYGKKALMIAGGVFVAYQVFKLFSGGKSGSKVYKKTDESEEEIDEAERIVIRKDDRSPSFLDHFKAEMSSFLVELAKEKLLEYIKNLESSKINASERERNIK